MLKSRYLLFACAIGCSLALPGVRGTAAGQTLSQADSKLSLHAALVLTPEFCATKTKKGTWGINQETFQIGKVICADLEPALSGVFAGVTRIESAAATGDAQVVLTPKIIDITATQAKIAFSNRELVIQVEWTAKDKAGKTVWVETVQGSAKHHIGNTFTYKKNLKLIVHDSSQNLAEQSANKMSSSPELRKLAGGGSGSGIDKN